MCDILGLSKVVQGQAHDLKKADVILFRYNLCMKQYMRNYPI